LAGRDLDLMILARESFGKFPHIPQYGIIGPIRRYFVGSARHFWWKDFPLRKLIGLSPCIRPQVKFARELLINLTACSDSACFSLLRFVAGMRKLAG
jgi:hypothetical protein